MEGKSPYPWRPQSLHAREHPGQRTGNFSHLFRSGNMRRIISMDVSPATPDTGSKSLIARSLFGDCWLSGIGASYIQSWPSQIWRFSAVPDWNDSFSGCMLLSGYPSSCCQTLRLCWQYRCVHWLIVTGTCSTPLEISITESVAEIHATSGLRHL